MKKLILIAVVALLGVTQIKAQDCREIVLPYVGYDTAQLNAYPAPKLEWRCNYSKNTFYESDTIPTGAVMHDIREVASVSDGTFMDQNVVIDLMHLSYYAWDFKQFQMADYHSTLCFRTPGSKHPYLVVRTMDDAYMLTEFPNGWGPQNQNK